MSQMHWRFVGKVNEVSSDGRMIERLHFDPHRLYPVAGRSGGPGVRLRLRGQDVQAKLPRFWRNQYTLSVNGTSELREIDGVQVMVIADAEATGLGPGRHPWAPPA